MKVYLAGPDVFRSNAVDHGKALKEVCKQCGHEGLWPFDNEVSGPSAVPEATQIYQANFDMIKRCDAVLANISPFRGPGMDAGTAWEIGAAIALGKQVYLYTDDISTYKSRVVPADPYPNVEDFGLVENLMITNSSTRPVFNSFAAALIALKLDNN